MVKAEIGPVYFIGVHKQGFIFSVQMTIVKEEWLEANDMWLLFRGVFINFAPQFILYP